MKKKSLLAIVIIAVLCFAATGCSFNIGKMKKIKTNDDPPSDKTVIKAVDKEYDGEGDWEITDSDEDDGDYTWELECEDGATAVVTWSEGDDLDDLYIKIDDSKVVVETIPDPTPTPTPTPEPATTTYSYTGYFTDTEDGANTYAEGTTKIELWISGAEVSAVAVFHNNALFYEFSDSDIESANAYLKEKGGYATFYVMSATPFEAGDYTYYVYSPDGFIEYSDTCTVSGGTTSTGSEEALNGLEQYWINDSDLGINSICWDGANVTSGIATYKMGSDLAVTFNCNASSVCVDIYCYPLSEDSYLPESDEDLTDAKYLVESETLTPDSNGNFEFEWTDDCGEEAMYIVVVSDDAGSKPMDSYFFTACFVSANGY